MEWAARCFDAKGCGNERARERGVDGAAEGVSMCKRAWLDSRDACEHRQHAM